MKLCRPLLVAAFLATSSSPALAQAGARPEATPQPSGADDAQQGATDPSLTPEEGNAILVTAQLIGIPGTP